MLLLAGFLPTTVSQPSSCTLTALLGLGEASEDWAMLDAPTGVEGEPDGPAALVPANISTNCQRRSTYVQQMQQKTSPCTLYRIAKFTGQHTADFLCAVHALVGGMVARKRKLAVACSMDACKILGPLPPAFQNALWTCLHAAPDVLLAQATRHCCQCISWRL